MVGELLLDLADQDDGQLPVLVGERAVLEADGVQDQAVDEVRAGESLQDRFLSLVGGRHTSEGPQWLRQS